MRRLWKDFLTNVKFPGGSGGGSLALDGLGLEGASQDGLATALFGTGIEPDPIDDLEPALADATGPGAPVPASIAD